MKKEVINEFLKEMKSVIEQKLRKPLENYGFFEKVLDAYNEWNEYRKDGNGYIFDITKKEDVMCCLKGGMSLMEFYKLYDDSQSNTSIYFLFGHDVEFPKPFANIEECAYYLTKQIDEFLPYVVAEVGTCNAYYELWYSVVGEGIMNSDLV